MLVWLATLAGAIWTTVAGGALAASAISTGHARRAVPAVAVLAGACALWYAAWPNR